MTTFQDQLRANIEQIRTGAADFLLDTCVLKRKTGENVIDGESQPVYDDGETLACRLIIRSGSESNNVAAQERAIAVGVFTGIFRIQLPYGTDITEDDRIEYTDTENDTVHTLEVIFAPPIHIFTAAYVVTVRKIQ